MREALTLLCTALPVLGLFIQVVGCTLKLRLSGVISRFIGRMLLVIGLGLLLDLLLRRLIDIIPTTIVVLLPTRTGILVHIPVMTGVHIAIGGFSCRSIAIGRAGSDSFTAR